MTGNNEQFPDQKQREDILAWCADLVKEGKKSSADELYLSFWKERRKKKR